MYTLDEFIVRLKDLRNITGGDVPVVISDDLDNSHPFESESFDAAGVEIQNVAPADGGRFPRGKNKRGNTANDRAILSQRIHLLWSFHTPSVFLKTSKRERHRFFSSKSTLHRSHKNRPQVSHETTARLSG